LLNVVFICHSLHASLGVDHVVEVTYSVKFHDLDSGKFTICSKTVGCEGNTIAGSHGKINIAQYGVWGLEFNMKVKILELNIGSCDTGTLGPHKNYS
jgi:hypothetical protein